MGVDAPQPVSHRHPLRDLLPQLGILELGVQVVEPAAQQIRTQAGRFPAVDKDMVADALAEAL
jgi:hypothetical protein